MRIWRGLLGAYDRFEAHDGWAMAGYVAYSTFLSLFPFAIFFTALASVLIGPEESRAAFDALFDLAPEHVAKTLHPVLDEVLGRPRGGFVTLAGLGGLWVASSAAEALRAGLDRAYAAPAPRPFLLRRAVAFGFVLLAAMTYAALGLVVILAPLGLRLAEEWTGFVAPGGTTALRYALGVAGFALFLLVVNRLLPSRAPGWRALLPGVLVATVLWIMGAAAFSLYLSYAPDYALTYGAFAGVIVTLLFFYLTGAIVLFGAEVNAALAAEREAEPWG